MFLQFLCASSRCISRSAGTLYLAKSSFTAPKLLVGACRLLSSPPPLLLLAYRSALVMLAISTATALSKISGAHYLCLRVVLRSFNSSRECPNQPSFKLANFFTASATACMCTSKTCGAMRSPIRVALVDFLHTTPASAPTLHELFTSASARCFGFSGAVSPLSSLFCRISYSLPLSSSMWTASPTRAWTLRT